MDANTRHEDATLDAGALGRLGVDVEFPAAQTCCGQPMVNTGYLDEAVPVVRRTWGQLKRLYR